MAGPRTLAEMLSETLASQQGTDATRAKLLEQIEELKELQKIPHAVNIESFKIIESYRATLAEIIKQAITDSEDDTHKKQLSELNNKIASVTNYSEYKKYSNALRPLLSEQAALNILDEAAAVHAKAVNNEIEDVNKDLLQIRKNIAKNARVVVVSDFDGTFTATKGGVLIN